MFRLIDSKQSGFDQFQSISLTNNTWFPYMVTFCQNLAKMVNQVM